MSSGLSRNEHLSLRTFHVYAKERACNLNSVVKEGLQDIIDVAKRNVLFSSSEMQERECIL